MIGFALLAATALMQAPADSLHGIVRAAGAGEGIPGVQVSVRGQAEVVLTDAAGRYVLRNLRGDRVELRFERLGFQPLTVDVMVGGGGSAGVDVDLAASPVALPPVAILPFDPPVAPLLPDSAEIGRVRLAPAGARRDPLVGEPDVVAALAAAPFISGREELAPSLRVRGGSGDETLILLDGLPWRGPRPPGGTAGMLPSSAVTAVDAYTAVPPARYGDALSSTIVLRPQSGGHRSAEGGMDPTAVEQAAGTPLGRRGATLFVSGRWTYRSVWSQADETGESTNGFGDVFGHVSMLVPRGTLDFYYVGSTHRLAFPAQAERADVDSVQPASPQNAFSAEGSLGGVVWTDSLGEAGRAQARVWYSEVGADAVWGASTVASRLRDFGISAGYSSLETEAGFSISRTATAYRVQPGTNPILVLDAAPVVAAVFAARRWAPDQPWSLSTGVRVSAASTGGVYVEPRVWTRVALGRRGETSLSLGYARLHQYVQSARNEESVVDALIGADFPIAAGSGGLRPAKSDQLTGAIAARLGARTTIQWDVYARWLSGLALTPLATQGPFADVVVPVGHGSVWGGDATLTHSGDRFDVRVQVGVLSSYRTAGAIRYRTGDARGRLAVGVGYQLPRNMAVRLALWAGAGRPTTLLQDGLQLESTGLRGVGELAGSPEAEAGIPNGVRLPTYARVDLAFAKSWVGRRAVPRISTAVTVANLLNRRNALAFVAAPSGRQPVFLLSRTLSLRVRWHLPR